MAQETNALVDKVVSDWKKRQEQTSSVRYVLKGKGMFAKGRFNQVVSSKTDIPPADQHFDKEMTILLDFERNWASKELHDYTYHPDTMTLDPYYWLDLYDGKNLKRLQPREKNTSKNWSPPAMQPDLIIAKLENERFIFFATEYPVFLAHGNVVTNKRDPTPVALRIPLDREQFSFHGRGLIGEKKCVILRSAEPIDARIDEYWVDPAMDSVILRWTRYTDNAIGGDIWAQINIAYKKASGDWLPESWTLTHFEGGDATKPSMVERMTVVSLDVNVSLELQQFQAEALPGQMVQDVPGHRRLKINADGSVQEFDYDTYRPLSGPLSPDKPGALVLSAIIVTVLVAALVFRWWRRRQIRLATDNGTNAQH